MVKLYIYSVISEKCQSDLKKIFSYNVYRLTSFQNLPLYMSDVWIIESLDGCSRETMNREF